MTEKGLRDEKADYIAAYLAEHAAYLRAGEAERAAAVAQVLHKLGHELPPTATYRLKERAIYTPPEPVERAVEVETSTVLAAEQSPPPPVDVEKPGVAAKRRRTTTTVK